MSSVRGLGFHTWPFHESFMLRCMSKIVYRPCLGERILENPNGAEVAFRVFGSCGGIDTTYIADVLDLFIQKKALKFFEIYSR